MTETTTKLDELKVRKEQIWDELLKSKYDSPEGRILEGQYVAVCRKIRRLEDEGK